jgi:glycosyltransferase involved in cell wall biosynthesis
VTQAKLVPATARSLRLHPNCIDQLAHQIVQLEKVFRHAAEFDVVHFHIDYLHYPLSRRENITHLTTLHGRLDLPDLVPLHREFPRMPVVSISEAQRGPLPWLNWLATIYHGLPEDLYTFRGDPGKYLAFLGRISPEKRVDRAIEIAKQVGIPLKIAAKVDAADTVYFEKEIEPLLNHSLIEYLGEIGEVEKDEFLGNAYALLFPIDWPEPFGLVMIEAMACGTPIIAYRYGSVPEVMEEGATGFIVETMEEAVEAVERIPLLSRRRCREVFEERFSASRMAQDYLAVYEQLVSPMESEGVWLGRADSV